MFLFGDEEFKKLPKVHWYRFACIKLLLYPVLASYLIDVMLMDVLTPQGHNHLNTCPLTENFTNH